MTVDELDALNIFDLFDDCMSGDDWSDMWTKHVRTEPHPIYGPHRVSEALDKDKLSAALEASLQFVHELLHFSFSDTKTVDIGVYCDPHELRLRQLNEHFYFKNRTPVCEFLNEHRFLIPTLFQVKKKVVQFFGANTLTDLHLLTDPEDDPSDPTLFVLILTGLPANEAMSRLAQLDEEWWLDQPSNIKRLLSIDVEYVSGRV